MKRYIYKMTSSVRLLIAMLPVPLLVLLLVSVSIACTDNKSGKSADVIGDAGVTNKSRTLVMPTPPAMLTDSISKINYMTAHYWDNFDFNDTTLIHEPDINERAVLSFLYGTQLVSKESAVAAIIAALKKAEAETTGRMYAFFCDKMIEYLYEPASIVKNEEIYIPVAQYVISSSKSGFSERERAKFVLEQVMKNRIGEVASDFEYTLASGEIGTLHKVIAPYTLLFFYSPDCSGCANSIDFVNSSGTAINSAIEGKKLKVLAFYPDNDRQLWIDHIGKIPSGWITGYDRERVVRDRNMYDLKGTPAIYLLDENKRIILKGITIPAVEEYFKRM